MYAKIVSFWSRKKEFVSLTGKLWVTNTQYDFALDDYLESNEELYVNKDSATYIRKEGEKRTIIKNILFTKTITREEGISALRKISKALFQTFPGAREIEIEGDEISIIVGSTKSIADINICLEDKRKNHPDVYFINKEVLENYKDIYYKFQNSKTSVRSSVKFMMITSFGEYFTATDGYSIYLFSITKVMHEEDPINTIFEVETIPIIKEEKSFIHKKFAFTDIYSDDNLSLHSPKDVPGNAFLVDIAPKFIQFTKSGIVETNGVFFAKEQLEEVRKPWYIVEKTDNGWDIYVWTDTYIDGHYRIVENTLLKNPLLYSKMINPSTIYASTVEIRVNNDAIEFHEYQTIQKVPKESIFERYKIVMSDKTVYAPKKIVDRFIFGI